MLDEYKIIVDTDCREVSALLNNFSDDKFQDLASHIIVPGAVYLIGFTQCQLHSKYIRQLVESNQIHVILTIALEGSDMLVMKCKSAQVEDLVLSGKIPILCGGDVESSYTFLQYESIMIKILDSLVNHNAMQRTTDIYEKTNKPYKFLFLNGKSRPHRKYLLEKLRLAGLLDQALWTNLDSSPANCNWLTLRVNNENLLRRSMPVHCLPSQYELEEYRHRIESIPPYKFIKSYLFNNTFGEMYIDPTPYIDTYFSVVGESAFNYPYSFRTEKLWKPVVIGHPFIVASSEGYYRDLHNQGFRTFGHLIDESFDQIASSQARIERIEQVVQDLCSQDLVSFLGAARDVCEYNQHHLVELRQTKMKEFPDRFSNFLKTHLTKK